MSISIVNHLTERTVFELRFFKDQQMRPVCRELWRSVFYNPDFPLAIGIIVIDSEENIPFTASQTHNYDLIRKKWLKTSVCRPGIFTHLIQSANIWFQTLCAENCLAPSFQRAHTFDSCTTHNSNQTKAYDVWFIVSWAHKTHWMNNETKLFIQQYHVSLSCIFFARQTIRTELMHSDHLIRAYGAKRKNSTHIISLFPKENHKIGDGW